MSDDVASAEALFDASRFTSEADQTPTSPPPDHIVRVVVDVAGVSRLFDYAVPKRLSGPKIGSIVRVPLHGRTVRGWVVEESLPAQPGVEYRDLLSVKPGPSPQMVELCQWAAWRWAGRWSTLLGGASPSASLPKQALGTGRRSHMMAVAAIEAQRLVASALEQPRSLIRVPPATRHDELVVELARRCGDLLVISPTRIQSEDAADALRSANVSVVAADGGWSAARAGHCSVVGQRSAAFAPHGSLGAIVLIDEYDELLQNEGSPTWNAREVCFERGRREGVPVVCLSPIASLEASRHCTVVPCERSLERQGWATVATIDRRENPFSGVVSPELMRLVGPSDRLICVINRTGRAQMLRCISCESVALCATCAGACREDDDGGARLVCSRCATTRPMVCMECGAGAFKRARLGVTHVAEELERLFREPVCEVTAKGLSGPPGARVLIGTESVLRRYREADVVAFLEFDQELHAQRYRANDEALALLCLASRIVGGRRGRVVVQTTSPEHAVVEAARQGAPWRLNESEMAIREAIAMPPAVAIAVLEGVNAAEMVAQLSDQRVQQIQTGEHSWLLSCADRGVLLNELASWKRPPGRLRLQIDPMRIR